MPWSVRKDDECPPSKPWAVIKDSDNSKVACHETEESAKEQVKALYANEGDMKQSSRIEQFISHYGVKGMKWGVRRRSGKGGTTTARTKFSKPANKLSDVEINRRIKRLETEKKYNQLNKGDVSAGRKFAQEVLSSSGRRVATTVATGAALIAVRQAVAAKFGPEVANEVTRRLK